MPRRAQALGAAGCFAAVGLLWLFVEHVGTFPGDRAAAAAAANGPPAGYDLQVITFLGQLGTEGVAALVVPLTCLAVWSALGLRAALFVLAAAVAVLANDLLKDLLGPTRLHPTGSDEPNFPSGHVVFAGAFFGALALLALQRGQREAAALCLVVVVAMGPARVASGAHLVSDVVAGWLFAAGWLLGLSAMARGSFHSNHGSQRLGRAGGLL